MALAWTIGAKPNEGVAPAVWREGVVHPLSSGASRLGGKRAIPQA